MVTMCTKRHGSDTCPESENPHDCTCLFNKNEKRKKEKKKEKKEKKRKEKG